MNFSLMPMGYMLLKKSMVSIKLFLAILSKWQAFEFLHDNYLYYARKSRLS